MITIYKASAGSGKTFTLAVRYISLVIGWFDSVERRWHLNSPRTPARHRSILAVTFTNKATAEMKTRIVGTLAELSDPACPPSNDYMARLLEIFHPATREQISKAAGDALMQLLFDFGSFNVSTIDSFFQTVLRTFARELNLPDNYRIQLNQQEAIENAVRDMLDVINSNSPYFPDSTDADATSRKARLQEWILAFMESRMTDGKSFNLFNRSTSTFGGMTKQLSLLFNETYRLHADEIDSWLEADSGTRVVKLRDALGKRISQIKADIRSRTSAMVTMAAGYGEKVISRNLMAAVRSWLQGQPASGTTPESAAQGAPNACVYAAHNDKTALIDDIARVCALNLDDQQQLSLLSFLLRNLYPLGLFAEMRRHLDKFCREENTVLQSSTNDFLSRIISTEEEAPFIYERLGLRLRHFLLDEFQDTSDMQWRILRPLILESLSNGDDSLIIGDSKQSIYGFRNTDYRLLNHIVAQEVEARSYEAYNMGHRPGENVNYRSSHTIVRFNNALFCAMSDDKKLRPSDAEASVYDAVVQELAQSTADKPGYVDIAFVKGDSGNDDTGSDGGDTPTGFVDVALKRMLDGVVRQLRAGYRPGQIAVLVRKRSEGEKIVRHLLAAMDTEAWQGLEPVRVMSSDAILVGESPMVKMILARMRMLLMPSAADATFAGRRGISRFISRYHLHHFDTPDDPAAALDHAIKECSPRLADAVADDPACDDRLLYAPAASLVTLAERIVREAMNVRATGPASMGIHSIFISAFMDIVADYAARFGNDLRGFLDWWDVNGASKSISVPDDVDAINVLTIHKAKGLEFPCVHVPFLSFHMSETSKTFKPSYRWYRTGNLPGLPPELVPPFIPLENLPILEKMPVPISDGFREYIDSQYIDNTNLLYVALTRPTRELVATAMLADDSDITVGDALLGAVRKAAADTDPLRYPLATMLSPDGSSLVIGAPTPASALKPGTATMDMAPYLVSSSDRLLRITSVGDLALHDLSDPQQRLLFFTRVLTDVRRPQDIPTALRRHSRRSRIPADISETMHQAISRSIAAIPEASGWLDDYTRLLLSPEITAGNVPDIKRWRPDRIIWRNDRFIDVVEYTVIGLDETRLANKRSKVRSVMRRLAEMGHTAIRGYLWNIDAATATRLTITSPT